MCISPRPPHHAPLAGLGVGGARPQDNAIRCMALLLKLEREAADSFEVLRARVVQAAEAASGTKRGNMSKKLC